MNKPKNIDILSDDVLNMIAPKEDDQEIEYIESLIASLNQEARSEHVFFKIA